MPNENPSQQTTFGYLAIIKSAEHGYFGGYLIIGPEGRPLEFHCTAPVRPSRAQQILYGPTLEPFLLGEQIAGALLQAARLRPSLILVNCEATLQVRSPAGVPVVLLCERTIEPIAASTELADESVPTSDRTGGVALERYEIQLPAGFESERDEAPRLLAELARQVDPVEPFGRIEEAVREAQRLGGNGPEAHDQAA